MKIKAESQIARNEEKMACAKPSYQRSPNTAHKNDLNAIYLFKSFTTATTMKKKK